MLKQCVFLSSSTFYQKSRRSKRKIQGLVMNENFLQISVKHANNILYYRNYFFFQLKILQLCCYIDPDSKDRWRSKFFKNISSPVGLNLFSTVVSLSIMICYLILQSKHTGISSNIHYTFVDQFFVFSSRYSCKYCFFKLNTFA